MTAPTMVELPGIDGIIRQVRIALAEDIGTGDRSAALIDDEQQLQARVICRDAAVLCGSVWFEQAFKLQDDTVLIDWNTSDGDQLMPDEQVCSLHGNARSILTSERTALNFIQLLSGTATCAQQYANAVADLDVTLLDTRKTIPGLRSAQKYAVRCGGCENHRMGLFDAIMLKENHLAGSSIAALVARARIASPGLPVIVEVENLQQLQQAADAGADRALLDNFSHEQLQEAAAKFAQHIQLEASGNVALESVRDIAATGVHYISIGALSKDVRSVDFSMRYY